LNKGYKTPKDDFTDKDSQADFSRRMESWLKNSGYVGVQQGGEVVITDFNAIESIEIFNREQYELGGKIFSLNNPEYKDAFLDRGDEDKETWKDYGKQSIKFIIDEIKELEFPLTIYRGVKEKYNVDLSSYPSEYVENRSWTTDIYVAKRFSGGLGSVVSKIRFG
jgi:hypothetical protein